MWPILQYELTCHCHCGWTASSAQGQARTPALDNDSYHSSLANTKPCIVYHIKYGNNRRAYGVANVDSSTIIMLGQVTNLVCLKYPHVIIETGFPRLIDNLDIWTDFVLESVRIIHHCDKICRNQFCSVRLLEGVINFIAYNKSWDQKMMLSD